MIVDEQKPDGQPEKGQGALRDQHRLPAPLAEQPARQRSGPRHRQRLAQIPIGIRARAFGPWKPLCQQHERGGKYAALGHPEQEAHELEPADG